ncbi:MAG: restriction endonuclease subunit S [Candidatus Moraniibacteriota bacterium]|nr:MAG: restriction endonuclease subunit S [Candidatus Moranbacteria bacterium]
MPTLKLTKKYDRYPKYKNSGAEWVGEMPAEWDAKKLYSQFDFRNDKVSDEDYEALSVTYGGVVPQIENAAKSNAEGSSRKRVKKGDIAINGRSDRRGAAGLSEYDGSVSLVYHVLKARSGEETSRYFHYLIRSAIFGDEFYRWGRGIVDDLWTTRSNEMKRIIIPVPSTVDREKIAAYLDEKTALVDAIIEKKKKQIELLREKRAAIINRAVTSVDGETIRLRHHVLVNPSKREVPKLDPNNIVAFLPMEAVSETGVVTSQERKYGDVKDGFTYFKDGDVVLAKITPCYENGKAAVIRGLNGGFGFGTTEFLVLRSDESILPEYLYYIVYADNFRKHGEIEMRGSAGQKRVSDKFVRNYQLKLPSIDVQQEIVSHLLERLMLIDQIMTNVEKSTTLLQEFKSALISHVVTGKVRV